MPGRIRNRIKFRLERLVLRGAHYRLLVIAALIGLVSVGAGLLVLLLGGEFESVGAAVWWAFLRLSDPGYLGDDRGVLLRTVSTVLTVLGYVLFLGALIAILTQWLNERLGELESGLTPIAQNDHFLILGWTNRTPKIVRELVLSEERVRRFLRRRGARTLRIAILAERVATALIHDLRERLGPLWDERQIVLRTGNPLRIEHLRRVDFAHAAAILLPAADFTAAGAIAQDTRTIKTLLSIANHPAARAGGELPLVVAEIFDARKIPVARGAYGGRIEILASDAIIGRLIAQNVRHRGLSHVYGELLTHGRGHELYIRDAVEFVGAPLAGLAAAFPNAVVLGVVRPHGTSYTPVLNPPADRAVAPDDRLVLLARSHRDTEPAGEVRTATAPAPAPPRRPAPPPERRVLILGWSHKVPALLREFDGYAGERFAIDILSTVPVADRLRLLERHDVGPERVAVRHLEGDYTVPTDLRRAHPAGYDNVVFLGSDRTDSGEESDARTILGYLLLRELTGGEPGPEVLVELLDAENVALFRRRPGEVLISPLILSHMLAQVALRRELRAVFDELFGPGGAEISFEPAARYDAVGRELGFGELQEAAARRGEIALGVRSGRSAATRAGGIHLNPPRSQRWTLEEADELIVLATYG